MTDLRTLFHERQRFEYFLYGLMAALAALFLLPPFRWPANIAPILAMAGVANLLYLETTVTRSEVRVRFGYAVPFYIRRVPIDEIESVEAVTYSPIREFGGWGIRGFGRNIGLNARGNRGVRLGLTGGTRLLVGSQRAEELAEAIVRAKSG